jgi:hypothetical protein
MVATTDGCGNDENSLIGECDPPREESFCCLFVCLSQYCEFQYGWVQYVRFMRGSQNWLWNHLMWVNENLYLPVIVLSL